MNSERLFLDTAFIQALLNPRDDFHNQAKTLFPRIRTATEVWITEAIFAEVGNALSASNRAGAVQFIQQCYHTDNIKVVSIDTRLLIQALALYQSRADKTWGLTDCISFIVMQQQNLTDAMTGVGVACA
jgi:predicted nucleic acid-binding protein